MIQDDPDTDRQVKVLDRLDDKEGAVGGGCSS